MSDIMTSIVELVKGDGKILVLAIGILAMFVVGVCFVIPNESAKKFAKDHLLHIILGIVICLAAVTIVSGIASTLGVSDVSFGG